MTSTRTLAFVAILGMLTVGAASAQCFSPRKHAVAPARATRLADELQGRPVMVRVHADWCAACSATQAAVDEVRSRYRKAIYYVQFDVTDAKTSAAAAAEAKRLGLEAFFQANKTQTSTVGFLNPRTGMVVAKMYADPSVSDYTEAIDRTVADLRAK